MSETNQNLPMDGEWSNALLFKLRRLIALIPRRDLRSNIDLFLMTLPALSLVILFRYLTLPFLLVAFKDYRSTDGLWGSAWVGFKNFRFLFTTSNKGWIITRNTIAYNTAFIILGTILALFLAILLSEIFRSYMSRIYQTALFLPNFLSWVVVAYAGYAFLSTKTGMLNGVLQSIGKDPLNWYQTTEYWPWILLISNTWKGLGVSTLIYVAAILGINPEYYEVAQIDGANKWQQTRYITLPQLTPLIIVLTLLSIGRIMNADFGLFFEMPRIYMNPQLIKVTDVFDTFVYRALLNLGQIEMATAASLFQSVVGFFMILIANWTVRRIDRERALF